MWLNRHAEAIQSLERALAIRPDHAEAGSDLGIALAALGRYDQAISQFRRVLTLKPDHVAAQTNLIFTLGLMPSTGFREHADECRKWYERFARPLGDSIQLHTNLRDPGKKLRIGYVSADFRQHSASVGFGPVLHHHDRSSFEVVLYSGVTRGDDVTEEFRRNATLWRSTVGMSDENSPTSSAQMRSMCSSTSRPSRRVIAFSCLRASPRRCR